MAGCAHSGCRLGGYGRGGDDRSRHVHDDGRVVASQYPETNAGDMTDGQVNSRTAVQFLGAIAGELESRGLIVRPSHRQGMVTEIAAASPVHPERGAVRIGYDGFLIWERWDPAANSDRATEI